MPEFNSLPYDKILDQSNLKASADKKINLLSKQLKFVLGRLENIEGKRENQKILVSNIFSFSHHVFKRLLSQGC